MVRSMDKTSATAGSSNVFLTGAVVPRPFVSRLGLSLRLRQGVRAEISVHAYIACARTFLEGRATSCQYERLV